MPPRTQPKVFQLLLKTHKLTILLTVDSGTTIVDVKQAALGALTSSVLHDHEEQEAGRAQASASGGPSGFPSSSSSSKGKAVSVDEDIDLDNEDVDLALGSALPADMRVSEAALNDERMPRVAALEDFELAKGYRDSNKNKPTPGELPGYYEVLKEGVTVKTVLQNWETVYVQFREQSSGILMPVQVIPFPPPPDEEEDTRSRIVNERPPTPELVPSSSRHKRRRSD